MLWYQFSNIATTAIHALAEKTPVKFQTRSSDGFAAAAILHKENHQPSVIFTHYLRKSF